MPMSFNNTYAKYKYYIINQSLCQSFDKVYYDLDLINATSLINKQLIEFKKYKN